MCEYAFKIMFEYSCKYLNKQSSEYARILNVFDVQYIA